MRLDKSKGQKTRSDQDARPRDAGGKDILQSQDPNSLKVVTAYVEPSLAAALPDQKFQFERFGYSVPDRVNHVPGSKPVFNWVTGLKASRYTKGPLMMPLA